MTITLSGIIITKNEEAMLADCIDSLSFCDEIVVIDSGSTDNTVELAKRLGAIVYTHKTEDFAEIRTYAKSKAKGKWILYIDADERVSASLAAEITTAIASVHPEAAYKLYRQNYYLGNTPWPYVETLERLFQKKYLSSWQGVLHETAQIEGSIGQLQQPLLHYTHRELSSMVLKTNLWSEQEAKLRFAAHHPRMTWWRFIRVMITAFYDSYFRQKGYKAGVVGLIESIYQAFSMFITYAKLWELQQIN